ncbi:hypothetical protein [Enterococcus sp. AZ196]|uniref:hypothetical protein n=1 Tax=Enterococcus sp. AZ196 TaxID=2774659 RepID=UPI003D2AC899
MTVSAKEVKKVLKENGFDTRKIRIRVEHFGYGSMSITVRLMDVSLDLSKIDTILCKEYREVREDENVQGEYLEGCNTYVRCSYDEDVFELEKENMYPRAEKIYLELEEQDTYNGFDIFENDQFRAVAFIKDKVITLMSKTNEPGFYPRHMLNSIDDMAEALVILENGQTF